MLKGHPKGSAPSGDKKLTIPATKPVQHYDANRGLDADGDSPGYVNGGEVNTFRSDAEKKVDSLYGKAAPDPVDATKRLNDKIDKAGG